jgi:hypothetical protein
VGGPWFTVRQSGADWHTLDTVWLSNGAKAGLSRVQIRMTLDAAPPDDEYSHLSDLAHPPAGRAATPNEGASR